MLLGVTVNDTDDLSEFLLNRPGRLHYMINFGYPNADEARTYVLAEAPGATPDQVDDAVTFAVSARLNYDHLRALCLELSIAGPDAQVADLVADLNIRNTEKLSYTVTAVLADGTRLVSYGEEPDLFTRRGEPEELALPVPTTDGSDRWLMLKFHGRDTVLDPRTGVTRLDPALLVQHALRHTDRRRRGQGGDYSEALLKANGHDSGDYSVMLDLAKAAGTEIDGLRVVELAFALESGDRARFF